MIDAMSVPGPVQALVSARKPRRALMFATPGAPSGRAACGTDVPPWTVCALRRPNRKGSRRTGCDAPAAAGPLRAVRAQCDRRHAASRRWRRCRRAKELDKHGETGSLGADKQSPHTDAHRQRPVVGHRAPRAADDRAGTDCQPAGAGGWARNRDAVRGSPRDHAFERPDVALRPAVAWRWPTTIDDIRLLHKSTSMV